MNHNMGTHPIVSDTSQGSSSNALQSTVITTMPNQAAYLPNYAAAAADSRYNGQYSMYDPKQSFMPQVSKEAQLYDMHCGLYGMQSPNQSSSPPPPPRVYKPCVVCNDKSSGYHYGVSSCEGCKGFFRRSVQKNMQYTCHKDKNCPINKVTRNRCQYCRLQKCYAAGMSKEAVRNDRNKKRKAKPESASSSSEDLTGDDQNLIQDILDAHRTTCVSDNEEAGSPASPLVEVSKTDDKEDELVWERITELSSDGVVKIVDFAKKLPGFSSLSQSDQITLLKAACLEIMILRLSARYDADVDGLVFSNGGILSKDQLQKGGFGPLTSTIFNFAASLRGMNVDETEFAILSAICLVSGDRSGLEDTEKIEQMQEPLLEALKHYTRSRRQDQPHIFAKLLMKLTDLRSISVKGEKQFEFVLDHLANALSRLEAPVLSRKSLRIKNEPLSGSPEEPHCSTNFSYSANSQNNLQNFGAAGTKTLPGSMMNTGSYGSQMPPGYMGSLKAEPESSTLALGLPPLQMSPSQSVGTTMLPSQSPSNMSAYTVDSSPSIPQYLSGLSPTLSPNYNLSSVSNVSMMSGISTGSDKDLYGSAPTSMSEVTSTVPNHPCQSLNQNPPELSGEQVEEILQSQMLSSIHHSRSVSDIDPMKQSYNHDRNNLNSNGIPVLSISGADLNGSHFGFPDSLRVSSSDHHTPLSKIIAGAMTDTMQI